MPACVEAAIAGPVSTQEQAKRIQTYITLLKLAVLASRMTQRWSRLCREPMKMKSKVELIYCVMVVATAVLAGVMKCTASAACSRCSGMVDPFD